MVGRPFDVRALSFSPLCCSLMLVIRSKNDIHPYFFFLDVIRIITIVVIFFFFNILAKVRSKITNNPIHLFESSPRPNFNAK